MWPFRRRPSAPAGQGLLPPLAASYAAIDTELTGLDPRRDSIVSLGGLRVRAGRIVLAESYYQEVRPESALTAASIVLHGIIPGEVKGQPGIGEVLAGFQAFCGSDILLGHFVEIDLGFLRAACARAGSPWPDNPVLDTWPLYDWLAARSPLDGGAGLPRLQDPRLPALARALGVPCRNEHHALADAYVTAQVFQRLLHRLPRWGVTSTAELLRIGDPRLAVRPATGHAPPLA